MIKYNIKNERIKKEYYEYLQESKGRNVKTLDQVRSSIYRFEEYTKFKDFATFNKNQAIGFKKYLGKQKAKRSNENMSKSTLMHIINNLKAFFTWLMYEKEYKGKVKPTDIDYFSLSSSDKAIAKVARYRPHPKLEEIRKAIFSMPVRNEIERRDQAIVVYIILTGARDLAAATQNLGGVDIYNRFVIQDPSKGVKTKFSKLINTRFFPVGDDIEKIFVDWVRYLREVKGYGENDPLFPKTKLGHDESFSFKALGLKKVKWKSAAKIRDVFKEAFEGCGLPYYNPHSFRHCLSEFGKKICTLEEYKAWSQNLGHDRMSTTLDDYGKIGVDRQFELMGRLSKDKEQGGFDRPSIG